MDNSIPTTPSDTTTTPDISTNNVTRDHLYPALNTVWKNVTERLQLPSHSVVNEYTFAKLAKEIMKEMCEKHGCDFTYEEIIAMSEEERIALPEYAQAIVTLTQHPIHVCIAFLNRHKYVHRMVSEELRQLFGLEFRKILDLNPGSPFGETMLQAHNMITDGFQRILSYWGAYASNPLTPYPTHVDTPQWMVFHATSCGQTIVPIHLVISSAFALASSFFCSDSEQAFNKYWTFMEVALIESLNDETTKMREETGVNNRRYFSCDHLGQQPSEAMRKWFFRNEHTHKNNHDSTTTTDETVATKNDDNASENSDIDDDDDDDDITPEEDYFMLKKERLHYILLRDFMAELWSLHGNHIKKLQTISERTLSDKHALMYENFEDLEESIKLKLKKRMDAVRKPMLYTKPKLDSENDDEEKRQCMERIVQSKKTRKDWTKMVVESLPYPKPGKKMAYVTLSPKTVTQEEITRELSRCEEFRKAFMLKNIESIMNDSDDKLRVDWVATCLLGPYKHAMASYPDTVIALQNEFQAEIEDYQTRLLKLIESFVFVASHLSDETNVDTLTEVRRGHHLTTVLSHGGVGSPVGDNVEAPVVRYVNDSEDEDGDGDSNKCNVHIVHKMFALSGYVDVLLIRYGMTLFMDHGLSSMECVSTTTNHAAKKKLCSGISAEDCLLLNQAVKATRSDFDAATKGLSVHAESNSADLNDVDGTRLDYMCQTRVKKNASRAFNFNRELGNCRNLLGFQDDYLKTAFVLNYGKESQSQLSRENASSSSSSATASVEERENVDDENDTDVIVNVQHPYIFTLLLTMILELVQMRNSEDRRAIRDQTKNTSREDKDGDDEDIEVSKKLSDAYMKYVVQGHQSWGDEFVKNMIVENAFCVHGVSNARNFIGVLHEICEALITNGLHYLNDISFNTSYLKEQQAAWCKKHSWDIMATLQLNKRQKCVSASDVNDKKKQKLDQNKNAPSVPSGLETEGEDRSEVCVNREEEVKPFEPFESVLVDRFIKEDDHTVLVPKSDIEHAYIIDDVDNLIIVLNQLVREGSYSKNTTTVAGDPWVFLFLKSLTTQNHFETSNVANNVVYDY